MHELSVECISKGKTDKKYEFGNKVSIMLTKNTGVIVGALSLEKNDYDGHTLEPALEQYKEFYNKEPKKAIVDLGYRGIRKIGQTEVVLPQRTDKQSSKKGKTISEKRTLRQDHRRRSSIEANISHLKNNHRLNRNYYSNIAGDTTNLLLSAAAYNFKRMMRKWTLMIKYFLSNLFSAIRRIFYPQFFYYRLNMTF